MYLQIFTLNKGGLLKPDEPFRRNFCMLGGGGIDRGRHSSRE